MKTSSSEPFFKWGIVCRIIMEVSNVPARPKTQNQNFWRKREKLPHNKVYQKKSYESVVVVLLLHENNTTAAHTDIV